MKVLNVCSQSKHGDGLITDSGSRGEEPGAADVLLAVCSAARRGYKRERERMGES